MIHYNNAILLIFILQNNWFYLLIDDKNKKYIVRLVIRYVIFVGHLRYKFFTLSD